MNTTGHNATRAVDQLTGSVTTIDEQHRLIHEGMVYTCVDRQTSVANGANADWLLITNGAYPHFRKMHVALENADADLYLYEDTEVSGNGTEVTPRNNNRNSTRVSNTQVFSGPTVTDVGDTVLDQLYIPDTGGFFATAAQGEDIGEEWILKPNTNYLIRLTNNSGGAITVGLYLSFYEIDQSSLP